MANNNNTKTKKRKKRKAVRSTSTKKKVKKIATIAKQVMSSPVVSSDGSAAIDAKGTLGNIGNFVGKAAGIASKFLPGVGGVIASGIADLLNDPEWWESVPGQQITCNEPLGRVSLGEMQTDHTFHNISAYAPRPVYAEFITQAYASPYNSVINISDQTMNQYVMPAIRKVMQSVPLQDASDYKDALAVNITLYAIHKYLERIEFLARNGKPYLPNFDTGAFPILQTANFAQLQAISSKLREHLRANVRLPHTICEYVSWRFGRIYKSNDSEKSSLIFHTPIFSMETTMATIISTLTYLMNYNSLTPARQKAQQDLALVYANHVQDVQVLASTQFKYDKKEFMLRLNCQVNNVQYATFKTDQPVRQVELYSINPNGLNLTNNPISIDSSLDNATVFMASSISTPTGLNVPPPFPVIGIVCARYFGSGTPLRILGYTPRNHDMYSFNDLFARVNPGLSANEIKHLLIKDGPLGPGEMYLPKDYNDSNFLSRINNQSNYETYIENISMGMSVVIQEYLGYELMQLADTKAIDIYNVPYFTGTIVTDIDPADPWYIRGILKQNPGTISGNVYDISSLAIDLGTCTETVLDNEHVYALANLLHENRTRSESRQEAEKEIAKDLVDTLQDTDIILEE